MHILDRAGFVAIEPFIPFFLLICMGVSLAGNLPGIGYGALLSVVVGVLLATIWQISQKYDQ